MNKRTLLLVSSLCVLGTASAHAQAVQLPTYQSFSVGTTVSIPDRGAAYLGGVTRGAWSSSSRGVPGLSQIPGVNRLFTNRGIGSSVSSTHAYATATIIDQAEMDRMVLAEAAARRGVSVAASETDRRAAYLSEYVARSPKAIDATPLVAHRPESPDATARLTAARTEREAQMLVYLHRAEAAEAAGNLGAARCCYSVLVRRGNDEQQQLAASRMAALAAPATDDKLARREH